MAGREYRQQTGAGEISLDLMRTIALALVVGIIGGCAVSTERYYLPTDLKYAQTGTVCGFIPWGKVRVPLADSLSAAVALRPSEGRVVLSMQLALPQGTTVRLTQPEVRLQIASTGPEYSARLSRFQVSVFGRDGRPGRHEYVDAVGILEGKGRNVEFAGPNTQYARKDLFFASAVFLTEPAAAYVLKVPAIEVNGVLRPAQAISVALVEKTGVAACVQ